VINGGTKMRKLALLIALIVLLLCGISYPSIFAGAQNKSYRADTLYDDDMIIAGSNIKFESKVSGDLIISGWQVVTSGPVEGNINCAGMTVNIYGPTLGSIRAFAQSIDINAPVGRNIIAFGQTINIGPAAEITKDANLFGSKVNFEGKIGNKLKIDANEITIAGTINGNLDIKGNDIEIKPNTIVNGDFVYTSPNEIKMPAGVQIKGETRWTAAKKETDSEKYRAFGPIMFMLWMYLILSFIFNLIVFIISMFLGNAALIPIVFLALIASGLVVLSLSKKNAVKSIEVIRHRPLVTLGLGFVAILLFPIVTGLAILTLIGIPIGIIILCAFGIFVFAGSIYVATYIGSLICKIIGIKKQEPSFVCMILGVLVLASLSLIPVIGLIIDLAVVMIGLGSVIMSLEIFKSKAISLAVDPLIQKT
jgi:cytoskeletal protein CcmA (bactofilin family)